MKKTIFFLFCMVFSAFFAGCAPQQTKKCMSPEDNPDHHYLRGMEALEKGDLNTAVEKFDRANYCDEKYSRSFSGLAIVYAEKARAQKDPAFRNVEAGRSTEYLKKAEKLADSPEDGFDHAAASIRCLTAMKPKDWLKKTADAYDDAKGLKPDERKLIYYQGTEAATYFMGIAYLEALEFTKARDAFAEALNSKREGKWHGKADKAWKKTDKIVRAAAGISFGDVGKKIAVKDAVGRGDLAALLTDELRVDKLFAGRISAKSQTDAMRAEFTPADMLNNPFREEVLTVMKWKIRGLEPRYDETTKAYLFMPEEPVKRGEMAFILEDVLIKLTGDEKLATAYFGQERSPFPDVRPTSPLYNAVMNMTSRNIMEAELSGEFRINDPVDGAEAVLAIRMLRQKMNIY